MRKAGRENLRPRRGRFLLSCLPQRYLFEWRSMRAQCGENSALSSFKCCCKKPPAPFAMRPGPGFSGLAGAKEPISVARRTPGPRSRRQRLKNRAHRNMNRLREQHWENQPRPTSTASNTHYGAAVRALRRLRVTGLACGTVASGRSRHRSGGRYSFDAGDGRAGFAPPATTPGMLTVSMLTHPQPPCPASIRSTV